MFHSKQSTTTITCVAALLLITQAACSDSEDSTKSDKTSEKTSKNQEGDNEGSDGGRSDQSPVYAIAAYDRANMLTYVSLTDSLTGELTTDDAIQEIQGEGVIVGPSASERLYVGNGGSGELTRYALTADGSELEEGASLNFQAAGVTGLAVYPSAFQFIGENKAYLFTPEKVVLWDPEDMSLLGEEIELPGVIRDNPETDGEPYTTSHTAAPIKDGKMLYYFTAWDSRSAGVIKVASASTVVAIDTEEDSAEVYVDERCGYARDGVVAGDYIYLASEALASATHYLDKANAEQPCMIRFNTKTREFDPQFFVKLNSLAEGAPVGSLVTAPSGEAFLYVLDTDTAEAAIADNPMLSHARFLSIDALWRTALLTPGDEPTLELLDNPLTSGAVIPHTLAEGFKVSPTFVIGDGQLREVTSDGLVPTDRADAQLAGDLRYIVKLR